MKAIKSGFTLVELMVVVLVVAILTSLSVPQYMNSLEKARVSEAVTYTNTINTALTAFYAENGHCNVAIVNLPITLAYEDTGLSSDGESTIKTKTFEYFIRPDCVTVAARRLSGTSTAKAYWIWALTKNAYAYSSQRGKSYCVASNDETKKICAMAAANEGNTCTWNNTRTCYQF